MTRLFPLVVQLISAQRALDDAMIRGDPDDLIEMHVALVADLQQQLALARAKHDGAATAGAPAQ
jgi:hypothetical protein